VTTPTVPVPAMAVTQPHDPAACELCSSAGGEVLFAHPLLRVVLVDDALYPGFCRVVWQAHVAEMTDLTPPQRSLCMQVVCKVEQALREALQPHKINLASLGNMTPHLHWHVIARFADDAHFPTPVWGSALRVPTPATLAARSAQLPQLRRLVAAHCATLDADTAGNLQ
jgi:diadenosine tetraphosphate (Ap4A) HIT family hydrolase